jgi:hypothetical protein
VAKGAFRNVILDVTSGVLPISNGSFDASSLIFGFPAGSTASLDYDLVLSKGTVPLTGLSTNKVSEAGTILAEGGGQKLVIRVDTEFKFKALSDNDSTARLFRSSGRGYSRPAQLVISEVTFADKNSPLRLKAHASAQVQSTTDLKTWQARTVERKTRVTSDLHSRADWCDRVLPCCSKNYPVRPSLFHTEPPTTRCNVLPPSWKKRRRWDPLASMSRRDDAGCSGSLPSKPRPRRQTHTSLTPLLLHCAGR